MRRRGAESVPGCNQRSHRLPTLIATLVVLSACTESVPTGVPGGTLDVTVSTTGSIIDGDGYVVTLDGSQSLSVLVNGSVRFLGVPVGDHEVELQGVAENCVLNEVTPRTVKVESGIVASTSFEVTCSLVLPKISFISFNNP